MRKIRLQITAPEHADKRKEYFYQLLATVELPKELKQSIRDFTEASLERFIDSCSHTGGKPYRATRIYTSPQCSVTIQIGQKETLWVYLKNIWMRTF